MNLSVLKQWAFSIKRNIYTLYQAAGDPRVPLLPKFIIVCVIAYAVSPIDLIPDFIPVLGYLDDLILLPLGIWLAIKLVPSSIWEEYRLMYREATPPKIPGSKWAAAVVIVVWIIFFLICALSLKKIIVKS